LTKGEGEPGPPNRSSSRLEHELFSPRPFSPISNGMVAIIPQFKTMPGRLYFFPSLETLLIVTGLPRSIPLTPQRESLDITVIANRMPTPVLSQVRLHGRFRRPLLNSVLISCFLLHMPQYFIGRLLLLFFSFCASRVRVFLSFPTFCRPTLWACSPARCCRLFFSLFSIFALPRALLLLSFRAALARLPSFAPALHSLFPPSHPQSGFTSGFRVY